MKNVYLLLMQIKTTTLKLLMTMFRSMSYRYNAIKMFILRTLINSILTLTLKFINVSELHKEKSGKYNIGTKGGL